MLQQLTEEEGHELVLSLGFYARTHRRHWLWKKSDLLPDGWSRSFVRQWLGISGSTSHSIDPIYQSLIEAETRYRRNPERFFDYLRESVGAYPDWYALRAYVTDRLFDFHQFQSGRREVFRLITSFADCRETHRLRLRDELTKLVGWRARLVRQIPVAIPYGYPYPEDYDFFEALVADGDPRVREAFRHGEWSDIESMDRT